MTDNVSDTLNKAADLIEERGWTAGALGWEQGGPYCLLGGIGAAAEVRIVDGMHFVDDIIITPAANSVAAHLNVEMGQDGEGVYHWNDADERTATEVIEVLRDTALIESARERETAEQATA